jgi:hypothetical protein
MDREFTPFVLNLIRGKLPKDTLYGVSDADKVLMILDVWTGMRETITKHQENLDGALKDLEYTLNLLNVAESNLTDEHAELKKGINDWLDYYRNLSKQEK